MNKQNLPPDVEKLISSKVVQNLRQYYPKCGFLYVISNTSWSPKTLKFGQTIGNLLTRFNNYNSANEKPIICKYAIVCLDIIELEERIKKRVTIEGIRIDNRKEWVSVDEKKFITMIYDYIILDIWKSNDFGVPVYDLKNIDRSLTFGLEQVSLPLQSTISLPVESTTSFTASQSTSSPSTSSILLTSTFSSILLTSSNSPSLLTSSLSSSLSTSTNTEPTLCTDTESKSSINTEPTLCTDTESTTNLLIQKYRNFDFVKIKSKECINSIFNTLPPVNKYFDFRQDKLPISKKGEKKKKIKSKELKDDNGDLISLIDIKCDSDTNIKYDSETKIECNKDLKPKSDNNNNLSITNLITDKCNNDLNISKCNSLMYSIENDSKAKIENDQAQVKVTDNSVDLKSKSTDAELALHNNSLTSNISAIDTDGIANLELNQTNQTNQTNQSETKIEREKKYTSVPKPIPGVYYDPVRGRWIGDRNGKRKSFSERKYGAVMAKDLAVQYKLSY